MPGSQAVSQAFPQPPAPRMYPQGRFEPPYPYPPPLPPPGRNYAKVVALVAIALLAVGVLVLVVLGLHISGSATTPGGGMATSAPVVAVCKPGSYGRPSQRYAPTFQGATDVAVCMGKLPWTTDDPVAEGFDPSDRYGPIWIVQFSSLAAARNEATTDNLAGATTIGTVDGRTVLFFAPADWTGASLEPLAQFGFTVTPAI